MNLNNLEEVRSELYKKSKLLVRGNIDYIENNACERFNEDEDYERICELMDWVNESDEELWDELNELEGLVEGCLDYVGD